MKINLKNQNRQKSRKGKIKNGESKIRNREKNEYFL